MDNTVTDAALNNANYQEMLREQSARAASVDASHAHGGGHGR